MEKSNIIAVIEKAFEEVIEYTEVEEARELRSSIIYDALLNAGVLHE